MIAGLLIFAIFLALRQPAVPPDALILLNDTYAEKHAKLFDGRSWQGVFLSDRGSGRVAPITLESGGRSAGCTDDEFVVELKSKPAGALYAISSSILRPRSISSVPMDYPISMSQGGQAEVVLPLGNRRYILRRQNVKEDLSDARVTLTDGRQTQMLFAVGAFVDEPHFTVHWAGDMDGDSQLDLIVTLSHKYSIFPTRLLLSSVARTGELTGVAAALDRNSC